MDMVDTNPRDEAADGRTSSNRRRFLATTGTVVGGAVLGSTLSGSALASDAPAGYSMDETVSGVPCWTEHDAGGGTNTSIGTGRDAWDEWDGCTPIAASMILGYHENISESENDAREALIDRLHVDMNTSSDGYTDPIKVGDLSPPLGDEVLQPIVDGIEDYSEGSNDYSASQATMIDAEYVLQQIENKDRPFMLNMLNGGRAEDYPDHRDKYGNHSVTVVGYSWDGGAQVDELLIHDGWNDSTHVLEWGNWDAYGVVTVEKDNGGGGGWWPW